MPVSRKQLLRDYLKGDTYDEERCGLILKDGTIIETLNTHDEPLEGFRIDAAELLKHIDHCVASWHTHPYRTSQLSQEDYQGFRQWPKLSHYIVGEDGVRRYVVSKGAIREAS